MTRRMNLERLRNRTGALLLLMLAFAVPSLAQTNKATITGTVTDAKGAVLEGATVTITSVGTNAEREVKTSSDGVYKAPLLDIGIYKISATAQGFQTTVLGNIELHVGDTLSIDVTLQPTGATESVTVTADAPLVQTESSERGNVITGRQITELPLADRNFTLLATLTPGVAVAANVSVGGSAADSRQFNNGDPRAGGGGPGSSNSQGDTPTSRFARSGGGTLTVNGQRPTNNSFSLDGVDNNEPQFGTIGVFPNPDVIAEFKVTTSIPPADVGRASGAVVTVSTRPGTNLFHGSGYYYGENSALNAFHPMLKRNRAIAIAQGDTFIPDKAVQQIHEFGGVIGGPIIKDRLFFFYDFLGKRNNIPFPFTTSVPTARSRNGDFSEFATCGGIRDPLTGQPFAGNIIPANRLDPVAKRILALYPLPTADIPCPGQFASNYSSIRQNKERTNNHGIRLDYKLSGSNSLTGRFTNQTLTTLRENFFPTSLIGSPGLPTAGFGAGEEVGDSRQLVINDTHTFSPTLLNEFRFGLTRVDIGIHNCGVLGACGVSPTWSSDVGIPNSNLGDDETSGGLGLGFTGTGFVEFLGDAGLFQAKSTNPYFADNLTIIKGSHALKVGGEVRLRHTDTICSGCIQAGDEKGGIGFDSGTASGAGNAQANMLLSVTGFSQRSRTFGGIFELRTQELGFFVQDDWKVNDRLTLNLGLRYDLLPGQTAGKEASGRISYYFPEDQQVVVATDSDDRVVELDKNNFGPRIGFAYALSKDKNIVLRGGYGIVYTSDGLLLPPGVSNPPFFNVDFSSWTLAQGPPLLSEGLDPVNLPQFTNLATVDRQQKNAYVHQFQLSLQYQFSREFSLDIGYVRNRSKNLLANLQLGTDPNLANAGTGQGIARNKAGQLINSAQLFTNAAESSYDGLQMQLQKRLSHNIQGGASYTWSHTIDNNTGIFTGIGDSKNQGRQGPVHPFDFDFDRGNSVLDIPHLFSAYAIIDLPFGKGQRFMDRSGPVDKLFGGWQMNLTESARSGFPFSVVCQCALVRPSLVGDPFDNVPAGRFLNPAAFSTTASITTITNEAGQPVRFGNLGRNTFRGPSIYNTNLSVVKNTTVTEKTRLQIGFDFFNLFNHTNLTVPNNNMNDVGVSNGRPTGFGVFDGSYGGRVIRYRAKFIF